MAGTRGYFKDGRWIEEKESPAPEPGPESHDTGERRSIDALVSEAGRSVEKAIGDVVSLGKTLLGTEEGRAHIEQKARQAGERLENAIEEIAETARKNLRR